MKENVNKQLTQKNNIKEKKGQNTNTVCYYCTFFLLVVVSIANIFIFE